MEWRVRQRRSCFIEGLDENVIRLGPIGIAGNANLALDRNSRTSVPDGCLIRTAAHILGESDLVLPGERGVLNWCNCYHPLRALNCAVCLDHCPVVLALQGRHGSNSLPSATQSYL